MIKTFLQNLLYLLKASHKAEFIAERNINMLAFFLTELVMCERGLLIHVLKHIHPACMCRLTADRAT